MAALWENPDPKAWQAQLDSYWEVVKGTGKEQLDELDRWFVEELPGILTDRKDPLLTHAELVKLVDWKMTRAKWRPNLQKYAREADPKAVQDASSAALSLLKEYQGLEPPASVIKEAVEKLSKPIKGMGPATASAVLSAYNPSIPWTSDEAMEAALGSKGYTVKEVLNLTAALREKAAELSKAGRRHWSAKEVEQCLYAAKLAAAGGASGSSKRKGGASGGTGGASGRTGRGSGSKKPKC